MPQQLNLYTRSLCQSRQPNALGNLLLAQGALVAAALAIGGGLQWHARQLQQDTQQLAAQTETRRNGLQQTAATPTEQRQQSQLQRLREREAAVQRLQGLLANGTAGRREGYAAYLEALARQSHPAVWITGLKLQGSEDAIELQGRMRDPGVLPDYLRSLQSEPQFKGRPFATLQIRRGGATSTTAAATDESPETGAQPEYSEFLLSSQPPTTAPSKP